MPGAVSLPQAELALRLAEIPRDRDVLAVCAAGSRSLRVTHYLHHLGYDRVTNLDGGTQGWIEAGHPIENGTLP